MKNLNIIYMDGYGEVWDADNSAVIFSTKLNEVFPDPEMIEWLGRAEMVGEVVDNVVSIWNETGTALGNLWSGGKLDEYLLNEGRCTQDEREVVVESLYQYWKDNYSE